MNLIFYHNCYRPKWWKPFLRGNNNYYSTNVIPCNFYLAKCTGLKNGVKPIGTPSNETIWLKHIWGFAHFVRSSPVPAGRALASWQAKASPCFVLYRVLFSHRDFVATLRHPQPPAAGCANAKERAPSNKFVVLFLLH
jgi:hypothetical protein